MDKSAPEITFDVYGVCNFCHQAEAAIKKAEAGQFCILGILDEIRRAGRGKKYDVIIGLSGGIDSATALDICVKEGLRPLCFSVDNGWNEPLADENILRVVEGLNAEQRNMPTGWREPNFSGDYSNPPPAIQVPFFKYTINLTKFTKLQNAFFKAGVINVEIPTDHIIMATAFDMANKYGIKYIISGGNTATESIMPYSWSYHARDLRHIKAIYKRFTSERLSGLPTMGMLKFNYYKWIKGIRVINILDFYDYNREESIKNLRDRFGYKDYGDKHEESVFTKWFQNFYLFEKFGIDKRKAHYSSLIASGQMTREEALGRLEACPIYPELGIEKKVMSYPRHTHSEYPTNERLYNFISKIVKTIKWALKS